VLQRCWLGGRKSIRSVKKLEWWGTGMVICLERDVDLHMAQLMLLPLTVYCFSKIKIGFTFLVPAHLGSPGKRAVKRVCVCSWTVWSLLPFHQRLNSFLFGPHSLILSSVTFHLFPAFNGSWSDRIFSTTLKICDWLIDCFIFVDICRVWPSEILWHCWLGVRKSIWSVKNWVSDKVLVWSSVWSEVQIVCMWCRWCH